MLSHELRNPLATIINAASLLEHDAASGEMRRRAVEVIQRESHQMARLVDDLLDVARSARGKIELERVCLDLRLLGGEIVESARVLFEGHGIQLDADLAAEPVYAEVDRARLHQIVHNLLNNAAKFTPPGGRVWLRVCREECCATIHVCDTGTGIPPDMLDLIFEPFMQAETSESNRGLGIGLALVRTLVELHGGQVTAHSAGKGLGSEFRVTLPLAPAPPPATAAPAAADRPLGMRILVVEDQPNARETLKALLELDGHEVETADDGLVAAEMIEFQQPEVALIDVGIPGIDGYQLARRLRKNPENAEILLVALTGHGQPSDRQQAFDAGFDAHLVKPIDPADLAQFLADHQQRLGR